MVKYPTGNKVKTVRAKHNPPKNKYFNHMTRAHGYVFDSAVEMHYYEHLCTLKLNFKYHEKFEIIPRKVSSWGKTYQHRIYTPDFSIYDDKGNLQEVVDVKGGKATMTADSSLRMAEFINRYDVPVVIATWNRQTKTFDEKYK